MKALDLIQKSKEDFQDLKYQERLWLLSHSLNVKEEEVLGSEKKINQNHKDQFFKLLERRKKGEPLQYLLKEAYFLDEKFFVEKGVFIPRKDTEVLARFVIDYVGEKALHGLDFGSGSGVLPLILKKKLPQTSWTAVDLSRKACQCIKKNKDQLGLDISILSKDVLKLTKKDFTHPINLITANPPYIQPEDPDIHSEVLLFEPPLALFSDQRGLGHIKAWFEKAMELLKPGGLFIFEMGWRQKEEVEEFLEKRKELSYFKFLKDDQGHFRVAVCYLK